MTKSYHDLYQAAQQDPEAFWMQAAEAIDWSTPPSRALDDTNPPFYRWFPGAHCNTCYNALDRHIEAGHGDRTAIIHDSPVTDTVRKLTYLELRDLTARLAGALQARGVTKGDRVVIYMPMVPEALVAMLACARLGAIHSVVYGGFAATELAARIDDAKPKAVICASCGIESTRIVHYKPLLDEALAMATHKPAFNIIFQRPQEPGKLKPGTDLDWDDVLSDAELADCVDVAATDPLYILYTSGTTGQPKGVVRDNGGHMVALAWSMKSIYNIDPGEVWWSGSDVGWVVGHSYCVYAPLLHGATTVIFEGKPVGTPDAGTFWRVIEAHGVKALFTAPTAFRAIKRADPEGSFLKKYDISSMRTLFLAGERADPDTLQWATRHLGIPVVDHWWQTETGWAIAANPMGIEPLAISEGSPGTAMPGYDIDILQSETGTPLPAGELGSVAIRLPLPPGALLSLWQADDRYRASYLSAFPGYYETGDAGFMDENHNLFIMARTDDVINVAGHRLSTGALEEAIAAHPDVAECAVLGVQDELKGQIPLGFLCLNEGCARPHEEICKESVALVRQKIGPVAAFSTAVVVNRLPKTRSGKILRGTVAKIACGEPWKMPATIEDPAILGEIAEALKQIDYPRSA